LLGSEPAVAQAVKVAGTDATASGALLQLSQALCGGVVRAELPTPEERDALILWARERLQVQPA